MARPAVRTRIPLNAPAALLAAAVACGCGDAASNPPGGRADGRPSFESQLGDVRSGAAARIVVDAPLTQPQWESLRGLAGLRVLLLRGGVADDGKAEILASLPDVERLVLRESPLSDEGLRTIAGMRSLRNLNLPQAACTAEGVRALRAVPSLHSLRIGGPNLAGTEVCRAVAGLPSLESLHLVDVRIGDDGLGILAGVPGLTNLYLDGAGVSDEAWRRYFEVRPGVHVHVDQAHHDRDPNRHHDAAFPSGGGATP